ncbi:MAG: hypothetical protein M1826_003377 [Phylliscum demangeonii]|nr:MAG: hypothetical protein M1826_003377 [Phylliscum demangeonii]
MATHAIKQAPVARTWAAQHANVEALSRWTAARLTDTMYQGPHFVPGVAHAVRQFVTAVPVALRKASEVLTSPGIVAGTLRLTNWKNKTVERALDAGVLARYRHPALDHERQALRERYLAEVVRHPERNVWWTPILSEKERTVLYR